MAKNKRMYGNYESETMLKGDKLVRRCRFCGTVKNICEYHRNGTDAVGNPAWREDCKVCYNIRRIENKNKKRHNDFIGGQKRRGEVMPEFSHQEWKECLIFFAGECAYCGCTPRKGTRMTRDHVVPQSEGGKTEQVNIIPSCTTCNSSKGASEWRDWYMKQPFFSQERMNKIFKWRTIMNQVGGNHD